MNRLGVFRNKRNPVYKTALLSLYRTKMWDNRTDWSRSKGRVEEIREPGELPELEVGRRGWW